MKYFILLFVVLVPIQANAAGRYEKKRSGECVSFDAMCLDLEAMATLASEHEKVIQQCKLDLAKQADQAKVIYDGMKMSFEIEIKKKDEIISLLNKPNPPKKASIWPYIAIGSGGIVVGAVTTIIIFLAK
jgi:hypothetical protein